MTITAMNKNDSIEFKKRFPNLGSTKRKYNWDSLEDIGYGFPISKSEMPSVNYSGPTLPDYLTEKGWKISCLKTGDPNIPLWVERVE